MLKMAKTEEAPKLDDDPRNVRDPVMYNRLRIMIEEEAIKPTWGCPLYIAARKGGWLTEDQRRAGDMYQKLYFDYIQCHNSDPSEAPDRELAFRRVYKRKRLYKDARARLYGTRNIVEAFLLRERPAVTEYEKLAVMDGLTLLVNFFGLGNK